MYKLPEGEKVGKYTVRFFIKEGLYNGTYRVSDEEGQSFFMKFYDMSLVPERLRATGEVEEILLCRKLNHDNVISYIDDGKYQVNGVEYQYLVTNFFKGSLLSEILKSGKIFSTETAKEIMLGVSHGIEYLHNLELAHNDLTPRNIILEEIDKDKYIPRIIDMGHLCGYVGGTPPFPVNDLTPAFCAPETFVGIYNGKNDTFSVASILYYMITGIIPWPCEISEEEPYAQKKIKIRKARTDELDITALKNAGATDELVNVIQVGLSLNDDNRPVIEDYVKILSGEKSVTPSKSEGNFTQQKMRPGDSPNQEQQVTAVNVEFKKTEQGGGFADIAGMDQLKEELSRRVIWVLKDKEKAAKYRLTPPNGMVLYGPPGCGKTFFAQKFAEESHFNFSLVNGSDLGSIYVHGTQGKIASLFKEAREKAPTIICFDEFDAFVPSRGSAGADHKADEVNEFLSQLNNCSKDGIFVIGTTNRIDMIDPAVLRKGRMDLHVEIPAPDEDTRKAILRIHMKDRPVSEDIDFDELASLTDNYASADLAFIVNEAAMMAALADTEISQEHLKNSIKNNSSSLGKSEKTRKIGY